MARQIGPIVENIMRRVRQEGGLAVEPNFATEVYSRCEQVINTYTKRVLASDTLTTPKQRLLFQYRIEFTDAIDVVDVRESNRRIEKCDNLAQLSAYDIDWFRKIDGTRFEAWCQVGRDLLILYPGQAASSSVTVQYVKLLTLYNDFDLYYNTDSDLPPEDIEMATKLAEIVLLARMRQIDVVAPMIKYFIETDLARRGVQ